MNQAKGGHLPKFLFIGGKHFKMRVKSEADAVVM